MQLVQPDLSVVGQVYGCLSYAESVYHSLHIEANATDAWDNTQFKHFDRDYPGCVPVWFSWYGTVQGVYKNWGHVAVYVPGQGFYSSPYNVAGHKVSASIEEIEIALGANYLGWSEDISTLRVTIKEDTMPNEGDVHNAYLTANGRKATAEEIKVYTSKPWSAEDGLYYGKVLVDLESAKKAPATDAKVLAPGKYQVN